MKKKIKNCFLLLDLSCFSLDCIPRGDKQVIIREFSCSISPLTDSQWGNSCAWIHVKSVLRVAFDDFSTFSTIFYVYWLLFTKFHSEGIFFIRPVIALKWSSAILLQAESLDKNMTQKWFFSLLHPTCSYYKQFLFQPECLWRVNCQWWCTIRRQMCKKITSPCANHLHSRGRLS